LLRGDTFPRDEKYPLYSILILLLSHVERDQVIGLQFNQIAKDLSSDVVMAREHCVAHLSWIGRPPMEASGMVGYVPFTGHVAITLHQMPADLND